MHCGEQSLTSSTASAPNFRCIKGCSDCCIDREYFPSEKYGRIGVLLLPEEKPAIEARARKMGLDVRIIPRLAIISGKPNAKPEIIGFQMMGAKKDGTLCPFLDIQNPERSPHGGYKCAIYNERPLACRAYPLLSIERQDVGDTAVLDSHCTFCRQKATDRTRVKGLESEREALALIQSKVRAEENDTVLRYATATGDDGVSMLPEGWVVE